MQESPNQVRRVSLDQVPPVGSELPGVPADDRFLETEATAEAIRVHLGLEISPVTLACMRSRGPKEGPGLPFYKFGNRVYYRWSDARAWALSRLGSPRSSTTEAA